MQKNIFISIVISVAIIGGVLYFVYDKPVSPEEVSGDVESKNVEMRDGIQYVTITALGGYSPRISIVEPNIPTKLVVKTQGTYDCSASLVIRSVDFQKILQPNGEEIIDLGSLETSETIKGLCGMGMYSFQIKSITS